MAEKVAARNWVDPSALRSSAPMRSPIMDKHITEVDRLVVAKEQEIMAV
jgi:ribosome recycling factor